MMETQNYWEDNSTHSMPMKYESLDGRSCKDEIYRMGLGSGYCEGNLNFATASEDDEVYPKKKVSRQDPMSHRIIEKRRRDRMNNCLADLSRLIPAEYLKKGRGRVEKTEIIEMAIRHMKYLQNLRQDSKHHTPVTSVHHNHHAEDSVDSSVSHPSPPSSSSSSSSVSAAEYYKLGYQDCLGEAMHFLVEVEGFFARDNLVVQLIEHLKKHCNKVLATNDRLGFPHPMDLASGTGTGCSSEITFNHTNGNVPLMCPSNNGLDLLSATATNAHNTIINTTTNNIGSHILNLQHPHPLRTGSSTSPDQCSSSGVSSYDSSESKSSQRALVPPPVLTSDDSNHSNHSHASGSYSVTMPVHHHHSDVENGLLHHHQQQQSSTYKFKNSIKQRFSADQRIKSSCSPPPRHDSPTRSGQPHVSQQQQQQGVPVFALHDNGGFYVPLTLEASLLRPHLGVGSDLGPETVLHPITISVNFNNSSQQQVAPSWSAQPSPAHHQVQ
ncbi:transcription factor cwo-like isoform X2 [Copidosoma floridanum]|uniref:transcription factor cwo-like isoform X2 n=1 Tax=Copidosoma floridanum TaxID=29053 RepID=UPI0006C98B6B|nr:transcription factor cwo-like isoform X2 [Copidosoma floridanum]